MDTHSSQSRFLDAMRGWDESIRQGYMDYTALGSTLFPEQELDAWLQFVKLSIQPVERGQFLVVPRSTICR